MSSISVKSEEMAGKASESQDYIDQIKTHIGKTMENSSEIIKHTESMSSIMDGKHLSKQFFGTD